MELVLLAIWVACNGLAWAAFGWDKRCAQRQARRVPEARLLGLAILGAAGAWLGSHQFRHKTAKRSFRMRLAGASVLHLAILAGAGWLLSSA